MGIFRKIHFINPPEVQGQVVWSNGIVGYDSRKIAQNRTGVKRDFMLPFSTIFQTQDRKGNHNILGVAPARQKLLLRANLRYSAFLKLRFDVRNISSIFENVNIGIKSFQEGQLEINSRIFPIRGNLRGEV